MYDSSRMQQICPHVKDDIQNGKIQPLKATVQGHMELIEAFRPTKEHIMQLVKDGIQNGAVQPLKTSVFKEDEVEEAFRYMVSRKHIGKILIKIREEENITITPKIINALPKIHFDLKKVYIITGGLGGFGLELANWMVDKHAQMIVLVSRNGIKDGYQSQCIKRWRDQGVLIIISKEDATVLEGARKLILESSKYGEIGGIFNLALVLRDGLMENQTIENFEAVSHPKSNIAVNLDSLSRVHCPYLDYFVMFSSATSGFGNAGQSNYGWANSTMENICEERRTLGLHGLAIQWGAIGDVGIVAENMGNDVVIGGMVPQGIASCLDTLENFLHLPCAVVSSHVLAKRKDTSSGISGGIAQRVAKIMGMNDPNSTNENIPFSELGLDSLTGIELTQLLEREFDLPLSMYELRQMTVSHLRELERTGKLTLSDVSTCVNERTSAATKLRSLGQYNDSLSFEELIPDKCIVQINNVDWKEKKIPLFLVHPIEGVCKEMETFSSFIDTPVFGIQCYKEAPTESLKELAGYYLQQLRIVHPSGPYYLGGYSLGGILSTEMALQENSTLIKSLIIIEGIIDIGNMSSTFDMKNNFEREILFLTNKVTELFRVEIPLKEKEIIAQLPDTDTRIKYTADQIHLHLNMISAVDIGTKLKQLINISTFLAKHKPTTKFMGQTVYIKCSDRHFDSFLPTQESEWNNPEVYIVEGTHHSILYGDSAKIIGDIVNNIIKHD